MTYIDLSQSIFDLSYIKLYAMAMNFVDRTASDLKVLLRKERCDRAFLFYDGSHA